MKRVAPALWRLLACLIFTLLFSSCGNATSSSPKEVPPSYERARDMPGHVAHLGKATTIDGVPRVMVCDDCHDLAQHGFDSPGSKPCARCHALEDARHHVGSPSMPTTCLTCHAFTRAEDGKTTTPTCAECHEKAAALAPPPLGKRALASHVSEQATCTSCHAPHADPAIIPVQCRTCHETTHAQHGQSTACTTCHEPHAAAKDAALLCVSCHVAPTTNLLAPKVKPAGPRVASHESCTTCHLPHDATKKDVVSCTNCHADHQTATTENGKGHTQCTSCHAPHAPASAKASCTNCHLGHSAFGAPEIPAHADCTSCHDAHAPKKSPEAACVSCHSSVHPKHPATAAKATVLGSGTTEATGVMIKNGASSSATPACIGCHDPHPPPKAAFTIAASCTSCHGALAKTDEGLHAKGKVECTECHQAHEFELAKPSATFCVRCHSKVEKVLRAEPGHASCDGCHGGDAHAPVTKVACGSCHIKEKATAPTGHQPCLACHAPHDGALIVGVITRPTALAVTAAFCTSCHANKKKEQHAQIPGGCANCHRPHGPEGTPSPPPCTSCHVAASLPGLHLTPAHAAKCESCHGGHTAPSATRDTCTGSCHAAQKTHQPEANTCQGCHIFR